MKAVHVVRWDSRSVCLRKKEGQESQHRNHPIEASKSSERDARRAS